MDRAPKSSRGRTVYDRHVARVTAYWRYVYQTNYRINWYAATLRLRRRRDAALRSDMYGWQRDAEAGGFYFTGD